MLNATACHLVSAICVLCTVAVFAAPATGAGAKHPVLDHKIDRSNPARYENAVKRVVAMGEDELLSFVPDQPITAYCECPKCYGGVEGNHIFDWTVARPDEMKCKYCGTIFPNEQYPEDQVLSGKNKLGETVTYRYYLNRDKNIPHFLSNNLMRWKRDWLVRQLVALGEAYHVTGKEGYARRIVLVFDRLAQVYPHYPVMQNLRRELFRFRKSQDPPYEWDSGRWGCFHNEIPKFVVRAYDLIYDSKQFEAVSQTRGYDVRRRLEDDFLRATYPAIELSNVVGYDIAGAALLGRVIHEPSYVHRAFGWMMRNVNEGFFYDGMWKEAPSYHYMTIGGLRSAFATVKGYSDPPGYVDKIDGTRFDNLDPWNQIPFLVRAASAPSVLDFPNGCSSPIHDTHPYERRSRPRNKTVSTITPGYGHASLGRGRGPHQMQAQLHFSGSYGHVQYDNLNLTLWAKEREMLPDLGYTWTQMRYWCTSTLGHNTVVVDRRDQYTGKSDGDLRCFFPNSGGVSVVEADGERGYRQVKGLDLYRRLLVMVPVSESDAYVVDVFRVRGGSMHDWALHGDADHDTTATCTVPLSGRRVNLLAPGEEWVEPTIEGARHHAYGMVRDVARGETDGGFEVSFTYADEPTRGLRVHLLPSGPTEVWLGRSPSVRRMGQGTKGDMRKAYDFWMPHLLARRQGEAPLASVFAAVHEPHLGPPFITSVEAVQLTPADERAIALRVTHGVTVDTIISTLDEAPYPERTAAGTTIRGRLSIVRQVAGRTTSAWLFEGETLAGGGWRLDSSAGQYAGRITAAARKADGAAHDAFVTDADLPVGGTLHGRWMIVTHGNGFRHGYEIDRVERQDGKYVLILTMDHGLRIDGEETTEVFVPLRKIKGGNAFSIPLAATMVKS